jgi:hypothetical protein
VGAVLGIGRVFQMGIGMGMVDGMRGDTCRLLWRWGVECVCFARSGRNWLDEVSMWVFEQ